MLAPDRVYQWDALACYGEALVARGHAEEALLPLERSVALTRRLYADDLALAQAALARARALSGRDGGTGAASAAR